MVSRTRIKQIITEALGVPSQIVMLTDIFTDMVLQEVEALRISDEYEESEAQVKGYGDVTIKKYETTISPSQSWSFVKNHPSFNMEEWKKFPMYRNKVIITVDVLDDEAAEHVTDNSSMPLVNGSHQFDAGKFEVKNLKTSMHEAYKKWGESITEFKSTKRQYDKQKMNDFKKDYYKRMSK